MLKYIGAHEQQKKRMDESQVIIERCLKGKEATIPKQLKDQLKAMLDPKDKETIVEVEVKNDEQLGFAKPSRGNWAHWGSGGGRYVEINRRCFDPWIKKGTKKERPARLTAVLFHEMVHIAGGNELDAESFENLVFEPEHGAVLPSKEDEEYFKDCGHKGRYVSMDRKTRQVSVLSETGKETLFLGILRRAGTGGNLKKTRLLGETGDASNLKW